MKKSITSVLSNGITAINKFLDKAASKKFLVWIVATHMTYIMLLEPQSWLLVSLIYMGIQGGLDYKGMLIGTRPNEVPENN